MLLVEGDPDCRSAGSFFKNPVVSEEQFLAIAALSDEAPPRFPAGAEPENQGRVKIPAAWLIEQAGFKKGYALGAAAISSRHTLHSPIAAEPLLPGFWLSPNGSPPLSKSASAFALQMEPVMVGF